VFVDIDPASLCIDPTLIERAITPGTVAILATHVYGNPCDVAAIAAIAEKHSLKVIYDGAHAFGVQYKGESVLNFGDISTLSFHATKLFHTGEGGALVTNDDDLAFRISYMVNFGHSSPESFYGVGINGKSSELHAAMGLCVLPRVQWLMKARQEVSMWYDELLGKLDLQKPLREDFTTNNFAYYPVVFPSENKMLQVVAALNAAGVFPRRYFYPALSTLDYVTYTEMQVAESVSSRVLCLPLYHDLPKESVQLIAGIIKQCCLTMAGSEA
jgi:dTDP-4-amino-4,6-dideoxygalactose transaminase